jgi:CRP-like cAMP-binding protein
VSLDDHIALLSSVALFELVERDALRLMAFAAETRRLRANEFLFRQGERSDGGYVVMSGSLATSKEGSDAVMVAERGALVGRTALFLRTKRPVSAMARERTEVLRISPTLMKRMLEEFPGAALAIREALADDLAELSADLALAHRSLADVDDPDRRE